jgi:hypothetical protein
MDFEHALSVRAIVYVHGPVSGAHGDVAAA